MKKIKLIIFGIIAVLLLGFGVYFIIASSQSSVKMKILYTSVFKTKPDDSKANFDGVHAFLQSGNSENTDYIFSIFQKDSETKQSGQSNSESSETTESSDIQLTPVSGSSYDFPTVGSPVEYVEINNKSNRGTIPRADKDKITFEFSFGSIFNLGNDFRTMKSRARKVESSITNMGSGEPAKLMVGNKECYLGCLPISTFGSVGDVIEFTFMDGSTINVLAIDAKSNNDREGSGSANQVNTNYSHGVIKNGAIQISAIELWGTKGSTSDNSVPSSLSSKLVKSVKIVGHSDIFN